MGQIGAPATFYLTSKFAVQAMLWLLVFFCQTPYYDELERRGSKAILLYTYKWELSNISQAPTEDSTWLSNKAPNR